MSRAQPDPKGRVLLAEDNAANRKLALAMLGKLGYVADAVANGLEAVEAIGSSPYDAVLMDCRMPEMDGFRATAEIRRGEGLSSRVPIIAMTADAMEGDRQRCLEAGMDDYLSKPVTFESLAAMLRRWVGPPVRSGPQVGPPTEIRTGEDGSGGEQPVLDPEIVGDLRELGKRRGEDGMRDLLSSLVGDAESNIARLRRALGRRDVETIGERAHALAGIVATVGGRRMRPLCVRLKELASQSEFGAAGHVLAEMQAELERVRAALDVEIPPSMEKVE